MNTQNRSLIILTIAVLAFAAGQVSAATILIDESFQNPLLSNGTSYPGFTGWTYTSGSAKARTTTNDIPGDTNYTTNQVLQLEYTNAEANYALSHTWSADDVYTLTFNASPQAWNLAEQRWVRPKIYQTSGDVLLWDPGEDIATALETATGYVWNGPGLYGDSDWQSEPDTLYSFTINASDFTAGTEGESIYLQLDSSGYRGMYYDNVVLALADPPAVPEPSTFVLAALSLIGFAAFMRRRKD